MDFTFGIITIGNNDTMIYRIIESIKNQNIPIYEIIIVGNSSIACESKIKVIDFDESIKNGWITRKKNIISSIAKYENIVLLHDYIEFLPGWYEGFLKFGNDFEFCINKIINANGKRFRDYTLFPAEVDFLNIDYSPNDIDPYFTNNCLLPYDFINTLRTNKYLYISGSYYVIKRETADKHTLNEKILWGGGEDVEYSKRLHNNNIIIKCNPNSCVKLLKYKQSVNWEKEINPYMLQMFVNYCNSK